MDIHGILADWIHSLDDSDQVLHLGQLVRNISWNTAFWRSNMGKSGTSSINSIKVSRCQIPRLNWTRESTSWIVEDSPCGWLRVMSKIDFWGFLITAGWLLGLFSVSSVERTCWKSNYVFVIMWDDMNIEPMAANIFLLPKQLSVKHFVSGQHPLFKNSEFWQWNVPRDGCKTLRANGAYDHLATGGCWNGGIVWCLVTTTSTSTGTTGRRSGESRRNVGRQDDMGCFFVKTCGWVVG